MEFTVSAISEMLFFFFFTSFTPDTNVNREVHLVSGVFDLSKKYFY